MTEQKNINKKEQAIAYIALVRAKQKQRGCTLSGRIRLTGEQETAIAITAQNMPQCRQFNTVNELEAFKKLLFRFQAMCHHNAKAYPDELDEYPEKLREEISQILREELMTNFWVFSETDSVTSLKKYISVTLCHGATPAKTPTKDKYKIISDYPFVFNQGILRHPNSFFEYLDEVVSRIDQYKDKEEYAILRNTVYEVDGKLKIKENDTLFPIIYAAAQYPKTTKEFLDKAADDIRELLKDPKYIELENPWLHFKEAALYHPDSCHKYLKRILARQQSAHPPEATKEETTPILENE